MVFSSSLFIFIFLPITIFVYFLAQEKYRNAVILTASLFFYAWGEPKYILLLLISIIVNFSAAFLLRDGSRHRNLYLALNIFFNVGILFVFKYFNFAVDICESILNRSLDIQTIVLPIGISFYTFQILSYEIDVYRGEVDVQKNILNFALYVSLFPQLIAGPIVRYADINQQICNRRDSFDNIYLGCKRFMIGFSKKIIIADQLSTLVDVSFSGDSCSSYLCWAGAVAYTMQIYFDFSAYSDMAIGLGKIFGFSFKENFNYPYTASSIQDFWRRWHMSLSSWFRDYLYIPLGGNRKGQLRTYVNYFVVFLLTGLWHGANYTFLVWGLYYAVFIIIERIGFNKILNRIPKFISRLYALLVVIVGWVIFRSDSLYYALVYIRGMFSFTNNDITNLLIVWNNKYLFLILISIFLSIPHKKIEQFLEDRKVADFLIIVTFVIALCFMAGSGYSPFLYFRF